MPKRKAIAQDASTNYKKKRNAPSATTSRRVTRCMTNAARRAVFDTAELLEHIFLQLPPATIFTSQRVCYQFRDIVATSSKIQERLLLRTNVSQERWIRTDPPDGGFSVERLADGSERKDFTAVPACLSDFLELEERPDTFATRFNDGECVSPKMSLNSAMVRLLRGDCIVSCSNMQLTDSPTTKATVWLCWNFPKDKANHYCEVRIRSPTGITVRNLVNAVKAVSARSPWCNGHWAAAENGTMAGVKIVQKDGPDFTMGFLRVKLHGIIFPSRSERQQYMPST